ncbi:MAG: YukJ family protein, partial [Kovacikia sp.]
MALTTYGVLKCRALDRKIDPATDPSPHYQVLVSDGAKKYRIAINVKSQESPSDLLYLVNDNFQPSILTSLQNLSLGFHKLEHRPRGMALDFIRGNLFDPKEMKPLPPDVPGLANDLKELIDLYIQRALQSADAIIYAFGASWGPEPQT